METQTIVTSPLLHDMVKILLRKLELEGEQKMKLLELKIYDSNDHEYVNELNKIIASGEHEFEQIIGRKMTAFERRKIYG